MSILADGAVQPRQKVQGGAVTLRAEASVVHAGLPYSAAIETVDFVPALRDGSSADRKRRIARVSVNFEHSCGVRVGVNGKTVEVKRRSDEPYGSPPRLRSGVENFAVPGTWGQESGVSIVSDEPTPFTVLSVIPEISVG